MAGGYKLFSTGEVLTAANVNNYLMNQTVMVFASAAARTTALSGVLAEGMISYRSDAKVLEIYNGTTWVTESSFVSPLTTKGDVHTYSTTDARLPVGSDGQTLVANSSAATGVSWAGPTFAAGKNKIINGDFGIWQRGTSFTISTPSNTYCADRFIVQNNNNMVISQQAFTAGTAPMSGYEYQYFLRIARSTTASSDILVQRIEDVRTFAGQTVTFSFFAKASAGTPTVGLNIGQNFGSGGSTAVEQFTNIVLSTSWVRYTGTFTMGSMSGKTIGTSSYVYPFMSIPLGAGSISIDTWGWQLETGSVATPFQTATGTLQGELAACQRYYYRVSTNGAYSWLSGLGLAYSTTSADMPIPFPVTMRTVPSAIDYSNIWLTDDVATFNTGTWTNNAGYNATQGNVRYVHGSGALTQYRPYFIQLSNANGYLGFTAEL